MSVIQLFFIEGIVLGTVFGAGACLFMWIWDIRDRDRKAMQAKDQAYSDGLSEGYGWRMAEMETVEQMLGEVQAEVKELEAIRNDKGC